MTYCLDGECKDNNTCTRFNMALLREMQQKEEAFLIFVASPIRNEDGSCPTYIAKK